MSTWSGTAARLTDSFIARYPVSDLLTIRLPLLVLLALPLFAPSLLPTSRLLSLAILCAIYVIVANGLHVIFSHTGQLSLAHSTLWGVGAYATALLIVHWDWPTEAILPAAALGAGVVAVGIGILAFRTAGFSFAIITFALAELLLIVANNWDSLTEGSVGISIPVAENSVFIRHSIGPFEFNSGELLNNFYYVALAFAYLSILCVWLIRQSSWGRTFVTIRENEQLARSLGVNVYFYKLVALGISGLFAGVAGVFFVYHFQHVDPGPLSKFTPFFTIQFLLMILIGGRFSSFGPAIGAVIVVFMPELINAVFGDVLSFTRIQIIFGFGLVLGVLFSPNGVAGQAQERYRMIGEWYLRLRGGGAGPPTDGGGHGTAPNPGAGD